MTLLEYVIENDEDIIHTVTMAEIYGYKNVDDYILNNYCPMSFDCFKNTIYEKPYIKDKKYKNDCRYRVSENLSNKCIECWKRKVI